MNVGCKYQESCIVGSQKASNYGVLRYSIEMEFEGSTRGVLNVTKVARLGLFSGAWTKITSGRLKWPPANIIWVSVRRGITQLLGRNAKGLIKKADMGL